MKGSVATMWTKGTNEFESSAKVVDGNLILSLPDAINPIVWRMELGSVKASALEVKTQNAEGPFVLTLKTPKGDVHEIAPYETRDGAVTALMRVSNALQSAEGRIAPAASKSSGVGPLSPPVETVFIKPDSSTVKWLLLLGGVLLAIFLFAYMAKLSAPVQTADVPGMESATTVAPGPSGSNDGNGVAQSADDLLGGF